MDHQTGYHTIQRAGGWSHAEISPVVKHLSTSPSNMEEGKAHDWYIIIQILSDGINLTEHGAQLFESLFVRDHV